MNFCSFVPLYGCTGIGAFELFSENIVFTLLSTTLFRNKLG
jgi:hypothetical protein